MKIFKFLKSLIVAASTMAASPVFAIDLIMTETDFWSTGDQNHYGILQITMFNGGGPINGTMQIQPGSGDFQTGEASGVDGHFIRMGDPGLSISTITYTDSVITGFNLAGKWPNASPERPQTTVVTSLKIDQTGGVVNYLYNDGTNPISSHKIKYDSADMTRARISYSYWNNGSVGYCGSQLRTDFPDLKQTNLPGCFWMENVSNKFCWVDAPEKDLDFTSCQKLDSCDGGGGESAGGCYKWAQTYAAPRQSWK